MIYFLAQDLFALGYPAPSSFQSCERNRLYVDIDPHNRAQVDVGQQSACMNFESIERTVKPRDLERNTWRNQTKPLVSDASAVDCDPDVGFNLVWAPEEMRDGLFVKSDLQAGAQITQQRGQDFV